MGTLKYDDEWGTIDESPTEELEPSKEDFEEPIEPQTGLWGWIKKVLNF